MTSHRRPYLLLILLTALLLFNVALRMQHIVTFTEHHDEIFNLWQTQGSLDDALRRAPFDWPPGFPVVMWVWVHFIGSRIESARVMSVLFSALAVAFLYRVARLMPVVMGVRQTPTQRLQAVVLTLLVFIGIRYIIFAGVDARAYGMMFMLGTLGLWLLLRWLMRPTLPRLLPMVLVFAALVYLSFTSLAWLAALVPVIVLARPRLTLRAGLSIGIGWGILVLPLLPQFIAAGFFARTVDVMVGQKTLLEELYRWQDLFGGTPVWTAMVVVTVGLTLWHMLRDASSRRFGLLLLLWLAAPIGVYLLRSEKLMTPRYLWWTMLAAALLMGWVGSRLPRWVYGGLIVLAFGLAIIPKDYLPYRNAAVNVVPVRENLTWLAQRHRAGDVMVIDAGCTNLDPMGWDFFVPLYFSPGTLKVVADPGDAARVWYVTCGQLDPTDEKLVVAHERQAGEFVGPWHFNIRLYERPPELTGVTFGDAVRLNGVQIVEPRFAWREGEAIQVRTWWSTTQPIPADYSIGIQLLNAEGKLVAQADGAVQPPTQTTPLQTSQWQPNVYYEDVRTLQLPFMPNFTGEHTLVITVYQWWDGKHLPPAENAIWEVLPGDLLKVASIFVWAW
jgi:hypothetical protein